jgi:DNA-binding response OmpR family regulator
MLPPKILVVDDSSTVRAIVKRTLSEVGYRVFTAADGIEAMELAKSERPQLAILDVRMPFLDGYGVCQELKRLGEPWSELPIIFLTSLESHALELLGHELGAYLQKPVCRETLLQTVADVLPSAEAMGENTSEVSA